MGIEEYLAGRIKTEAVPRLRDCKGIGQAAVSLADGIVVRGRVAHYRALGEDIRREQVGQIRAVAGKLSNGERTYLEEKLRTPELLAYLEVPAHTLLIDLDVLGMPIVNRREQALQAAMSCGWDFFNIKLLDECVERAYREGRNGRALIEEVYAPIRLGEGQGTIPAEEIGRETETLAIMWRLVHKPITNGYTPKRTELREALHGWAEAEERYFRAGSVDERLKSIGDIGRSTGRLMHYHARKAFPDLPSWAEEFFQKQGEAAAYFDSWKDYNSDGNERLGIRRSTIGARFAREFWKLNTEAIPDNNWKRYLAFLVLGGLFQLREVVGLKERT